MGRVALYALLAAALQAQVADKANTNYRTKEGRDNMARALGAADRAERLRASQIVSSLEIRPGSTVAEVGTGAGAMLPSLSAAVGAEGKVIGEDIFTDFIDRAKKKAETEHLGNVSFVLGSDKSPNLPDSCCDLVMAVDAYHHFDYPAEMLAGIRKSLRPEDGRFAIVDYYKRYDAMDTPGQAIEHIRLDAGDVIKEVERCGFRLLRQFDHVPGKQYIAIFTRSLNKP